MFPFFPLPGTERDQASLTDSFNQMMEAFLAPWTLAASFNPWLAFLRPPEAAEAQAPATGMASAFGTMTPASLTPFLGPLWGPVWDQAIRSADEASRLVTEALDSAGGQPVTVAFKDTSGPFAVFVGIKVAPHGAIGTGQDPWAAPEGLTVDWTPPPSPAPEDADAQPASDPA
ncbi:hypothetical protein [Pararhodospirillum oryzae]|uniref:Uncharacterized protein n=1 Tax=Pararhodospirillum oryzae TaxID=478448 RepID=A0A512H869_9PROT|nr:hypothetical protein [Pararhodospirillum oryzae]GEO81632.1 hypothetical protein ROR02_17630 [Pararhodospirillum oryzae]